MYLPSHRVDAPLIQPPERFPRPDGWDGGKELE